MKKSVLTRLAGVAVIAMVFWVGSAGAKPDPNWRVKYDAIEAKFNAIIEKYGADTDDEIINTRIGNNNNMFIDDDIVDREIFISRRLMAWYNGKLDRRGAIEWADGWKDIHLLQYQTIDDAIAAFKYYKDMGIHVIPDVKITHDADIPSVSDNIQRTNADETECYGDAMIGADKYREYLKTVPTRDVFVAVFDSGIDTDHPEFIDRIYPVEVGLPSTWHPIQYHDGWGHGTAVSSIITSTTLSNVKILPIRVSSDAGGFGFSALTALRIEQTVELKVSDNVPISVFNMSFGSVESSTAAYNIEASFYQPVITKAVEADISVLVAAGNYNADLYSTIYRTFCSPANINGAMAVAGINKNRERCSFSNYGENVFFTAPGQQVRVAQLGTQGYEYGNGTSFATPYVAAAIALLHSDATKEYSAEDVRNILIENASLEGLTNRKTNDGLSIGIGGKTHDIYFGYGLINMGNLIPDDRIPTMNHLTFTTSSNHVYSGFPQGIGNVTGVTGIGEITVLYDGVTAPPIDVGTYTVTVNIAQGIWFMAATDIALGEYVIAPKPLTITGLAAADKVYDGGVAVAITGAATISGVIDGDAVSVVNGAASFADKNIGADKAVTFSGFHLGGADAGNYVLSAQPAGVTANVAAKVISIAGVTAQDRDYNGTAEVALSGGALVGVESGDIVSFTLGTGTIVSADAGTNKPVTTNITLIGASAANYILVQPTDIRVNIETVSIASPDRIIPPTANSEEAAVVTPVKHSSSDFTAGPNVIGKNSGGVIKIYRQGSRIDNSVLTVYNSRGDVVNKVSLSDNSATNPVKRKVGMWNLHDKRGRLVSAGTYLIKGTVKTIDGKKEEVSVVVGVR